MKVDFKKIAVLIVIMFICVVFTSAGHHKVSHNTSSVLIHPADTSWTKKKAADWFNKRTWLHGLKLKPHPSINQLEFAREYAANKSRWDKGFAYLKSINMKTIKPGHYQIEGEDVYANVTEAPSKEFAETQYEVHQNYSDLHLMISGKEKIGVTPFVNATVKTPYDATKDIGFWNIADDKIYTAEPGTFFIFCPGTPHRPNIKVPGQGVVKKIVIKVRSAGK
jgi:biofilm protein TabA